MAKLTEAEKRARHKIYQQRWLEKKKRLAAEAEKLNAAPNYKAMYEACEKERIAAVNKVADLERLCKGYAEREAQANKALQNATLEYNARTKHMLECVKHAYISMQFATESKTQGGN